MTDSEGQPAGGWVYRPPKIIKTYLPYAFGECQGQTFGSEEEAWDFLRSEWREGFDGDPAHFSVEEREVAVFGFSSDSEKE
jgi:hypothetical protein